MLDRRLQILTLMFCLSASAVEASDWHTARVLPQKHFPKDVPAGNYSGITRLHDDIYAVVSDKSDSALYFRFQILIDSITGELTSVRYLGGVGQVECAGLDHEAIAKVSDSTLVIASEGKARLRAYQYGAKLSASDMRLAEETVSPEGWEWSMPASSFYPNYNFESLAYDPATQLLWVMPESVMRQDGEPTTPQNGKRNLLRLMAIDMKAAHNPTFCCKYLMDAPTTEKQAQQYVMGVSEMCAIGDGQLLVLEREAFIPKKKIGSFCRCKLYEVCPQAAGPSVQDGVVEKHLLAQWKTSLNLTDRSFANYEGMCLGPRLVDGSQVLILLSDSQNQYAGVLKDWFLTVILQPMPANQAAQ